MGTEPTFGKKKAKKTKALNASVTNSIVIHTKANRSKEKTRSTTKDKGGGRSTGAKKGSKKKKKGSKSGRPSDMIAMQETEVRSHTIITIIRHLLVAWQQDNQANQVIVASVCDLHSSMSDRQTIIAGTACFILAVKIDL
jgi:hypothetical protein